LIAAGARYPLVRVSLDPDELRDWDSSLAQARARLGPEAFAAAEAEGQAMSLEAAIAYGLTRQAPSATRANERLGLTQREHEVARLIVEGCSNREIAERLVISERTAEAHVSNLLGKANVRSRAQFAVWALQHRL
jgi:non-specific serine/threonine protein kinase